MRYYLKIPTILSLMSLSLLVVTPVQAQRSDPCSNENQEQPSQARREITNREYGLRFEIPANYRTELRRETHSPQRLSIVVRNPTDVAFLDCAVRNGMRGAGHQVSDVIVSIEPRPRHIRNVRDIFREESSVRLREILESSFTTIAGQDAVIYTVQTVYPYRYQDAKLIHPNGRDIITIRAGDYGYEIDPIDLEVMDVIISSLRIDSN
ncbi:hypothetical protein [Limnospira fusiformis]|uniref:hypothetical protein n=1 Tax=Limnospira fusiformis TaxID=54297 RepID=UPI002AA2555B|nr:hypothetical protein [Limnospira fusiformis LS22]